MPFILENNPRPVEIQFDPTNPKAKVEAEEEINKLLIQGFLEVSRTSQEQFIFVTLAKPSPGSDIGTMRILSQNGDDILLWDRNNLKQIREAKRRFDDLIAKGFKAYLVARGGKKGGRIDSFDDALEEILLVPDTMPG